jgi:hypothetical protein
MAMGLYQSRGQHSGQTAAQLLMKPIHFILAIHSDHLGTVNMMPVFIQ